MVKILFGLILLLFLFTRPLSVTALEEFSVSYDYTYSFSETGQSVVRLDVGVTNLVTPVYPTSYQLTLSGQKLTDITAQDAKGPLNTTISYPDPETTRVDVTLNPVPGKGKTTQFSLMYPGKPAQKNGQIWEIIIPRLADSNPPDNYELKLQVPLSFGNPAYMSPQSSSASSTNQSRTFIFTKDLAASSGVTAGFGDFQTLDFKLTYYLENPTTSSQSKTIALPPDTYLQRIFYDTIEPRPENISIDMDGNWLASYQLAPKNQLSISASGQVHILGSPVNPSLYQPSDNDVGIYTTSTDLWPADHPKIQTISQNLSTPRQVFDYVVNTLSYNSSSALSGRGRKGALVALSDPQNSVCTEFTDVFIALSRSLNIPAREHQGFALQTDPNLQPLSLYTDVLHAWPEYWDTDTNVWRSVDPTWTKTTGGINYFDSLDVSHFTFVIHGSNSQLPLPAGQYKAPNSNSQDVHVKIGEYRDYFAQAPNISWQIPWQFIPLINQSARVTITNPNNFALYDVAVASLKDSPHMIIAPTAIKTIPPFASVSLDVKLSTPLFPFQSQKRSLFNIGGYTVAYTVSESKFYLWYALIIIASLATFISLAFLAVKTWHLHLQKLRG